MLTEPVAAAFPCRIARRSDDDDRLAPVLADINGAFVATRDLGFRECLRLAAGRAGRVYVPVSRERVTPRRRQLTRKDFLHAHEVGQQTEADPRDAEAEQADCRGVIGAGDSSVRASLAD